MDRLNKFRLFFSVLLVLLDFLLLPQVLTIPSMLKAGTIIGWPKSLTLLGGFHALPNVLPLWGWSQLFLLAAILWLWFNGRGFVTTMDGNLPPAAGHGQHGTSRWMNQAEVERFFNIKRM